MAPDPGRQAIATADRAVGLLADGIDSVYLVECRPPVATLADDLRETVVAALRENASRERDCRLRHNGLVNLLLQRGKINEE